MTLKEMKEMAKNASLKKIGNEPINLSEFQTVGNKGVTHENNWEVNEIQPKEKTKKDITIERNLARESKIAEELKIQSEEDD